MNKKELVDLIASTYHEDREYLNELNVSELNELLKELQDHFEMYPNDDEYDD